MALSGEEPPSATGAPSVGWMKAAAPFCCTTLLYPIDLAAHCSGGPCRPPMCVHWRRRCPPQLLTPRLRLPSPLPQPTALECIADYVAAMPATATDAEATSTFNEPASGAEEQAGGASAASSVAAAAAAATGASSAPAAGAAAVAAAAGVQGAPSSTCARAAPESAPAAAAAAPAHRGPIAMLLAAVAMVHAAWCRLQRRLHNRGVGVMKDFMGQVRCSCVAGSLQLPRRIAVAGEWGHTTGQHHLRACAHPCPHPPSRMKCFVGQAGGPSWLRLSEPYTRSRMPLFLSVDAPPPEGHCQSPCMTRSRRPTQWHKHDLYIPPRDATRLPTHPTPTPARPALRSSWRRAGHAPPPLLAACRACTTTPRAGTPAASACALLLPSPTNQPHHYHPRASHILRRTYRTTPHTGTSAASTCAAMLTYPSLTWRLCSPTRRWALMLSASRGRGRATLLYAPHMSCRLTDPASPTCG